LVLREREVKVHGAAPAAMHLCLQLNKAFVFFACIIWKLLTLGDAAVLFLI